MPLLARLISPDFMPHGYCYRWDPWIVWLHVISDILIALSYYCIPIILIYFIRKRRDLPFNWIFWMFGGFILACGTTHLIEIWNIWHASYLASGIIKGITAAISVATAIRLIPLIPQAVVVPNVIHLQEKNRKLEREIAEREQLHDELFEDPLRRSVTNLSQTALGVLMTLGIISLLLVLSGRRDYPDLHTILDTSIFLLSGLLALLFWDIGARSNQSFPKCLAVTFTLTSLCEFLHALTSLQWSGTFGLLAQAVESWRPATWPPAAHLLPVGIGCSLWMLHRDRQKVARFAVSLTILAAGLFVIFHRIPRYTAPTWLGVTRPSLALVPLLWALVASACWRLRALDRVLPPLALMSAIRILVSIAMLYSRAPHDTLAMVAHLGRVASCLTLLLSLMQIATFDMLERIRSQRALAQLNGELEARVLERTIELETINQSLEKEIRARAEVEQYLRQSEDRLAGIIGSAMDAIITVDGEQRIVLFNAAAEKMFGCPAAEALEQSVERFLPQRFRAQHGGHIRRFGETGVTNRNMGSPGTLWAMRTNGEEFQIEASISQVEANGEKLFTAILRDITDRKQAEDRMASQAEELARQAAELARTEQELRKLNDELEHRVTQRTMELEATNKELEAFTYSVSHDLRAPLRHISGFTRILTEEFGSSLPAEAQQHLKRVEQGASRMGHLVDELLNLARIGRQALTVQVTGLTSIVQDVLSVLEPEIEGRDLEWKIAELPFVECDPTLIRQVFQNLISNALKYSRPRAGTVIEIGQADKNGQQAIFVKDNGVGFSMKYADKLFGVFQRLHRAEDFEGTGVGLATVHRIIQKHGGRVWAESELDRGATFYFTLGGFDQSAVKNAMATARG